MGLPAGIGNMHVILVALTTMIFVAVIGVWPTRVSWTLGLSAPTKPVPERFVTVMVEPRFPAFGRMRVTAGAAADFTVKAFARVPDCPPALMTRTFQSPTGLSAPIGILQVMLVELATTTLVATMAVWPALVSLTFAPEVLKPVPTRLVTTTVVPRVPLLGLILVTTGGGMALAVLMPVRAAEV